MEYIAHVPDKRDILFLGFCAAPPPEFGFRSSRTLQYLYRVELYLVLWILTDMNNLDYWLKTMMVTHTWNLQIRPNHTRMLRPSTGTQNNITELSPSFALPIPSW